MNTLFISDIHLSPDLPAISQAFFHCLKSLEIGTDALYILGDLFDVWIGDDNNSAFAQSIQIAIKQVVDRGIPVYIMRGNRDFLIGKRFCDVTGCTLLSDPCVINLYGTPTLLTHGDQLCTDDKRYQHYRRVVSNTWVQKFFLRLSLRFRQHISEKLRRQSQQHTQQADVKIMDVNPHAVQHWMQKHKVKQLIHGHTHRPAQHKELEGTRWVLGAWHTGGNGLRCTPQGIEFFSF